MTSNILSYFDRVCKICNARRDIHWDARCPNKNGTGAVVPASYFLYSGKSRSRKCDKNRNPDRYK